MEQNPPMIKARFECDAQDHDGWRIITRKTFEQNWIDVYPAPCLCGATLRRVKA